MICSKCHKKEVKRGNRLCKGCYDRLCKGCYDRLCKGCYDKWMDFARAKTKSHSSDINWGKEFEKWLLMDFDNLKERIEFT